MINDEWNQQQHKYEVEIAYICTFGNLDSFKKLLCNKNREKIKEVNYPYFFHCACISGNEEIAHYLLKLKPSCYKAFYNRDDLVTVCERGHLNIAKLLLQLDPDNERHITEGFDIACCNGHLETASWLYGLKEIPISNSTWYSACIRGNLDVAMWLLNKNPGIDICFKKDKTFRFCCEKNIINVAQWLKSLKPERYSLEIKDNKIVSFVVPFFINYPFLQIY
jgi:hypothetical protein